MSFEDNITCSRSSGPGSVRPIQLATPRTAGGLASALASYNSVFEAQRLFHDSSQPPGADRASSPDSVFPHEGTSAGSLQNRLYDAGSPVLEPPVRQHRYVKEGIPEEEGFNVTLEETRIDPPSVKHTDIYEQAIMAQEPHIRSMLRHYCGDSKETQLRALELILKHHGKVCRIERRKRAGATSGGVQSLVCLLCPPTSEDKTVHFEKANAVRTFAEHLIRKHLKIPNPFVCFATTCGRVFPYSQDRDRHEKQIHKMYRPKAYQALLKNRLREQSGMPPVGTDNPQSPTEFIEHFGPAQVNPNQPTAPGAHPHPPRAILPSSKPPTAKADSGAMLRSKTPVSNHRAVPYAHGHARSRSSTPRPSREPDRNISQSIPFHNGNHRTMRGTDDREQPIMTVPESQMLRASSTQSRARFNGMQESVDGVAESYHSPGGTQTQMSNGHYSAPTTMSHPGSNMVSNPLLIDSAMPSSIGYRDPSTCERALAPPPQFADHAPMGRAYEQPEEGPTYCDPMYNGMRNGILPFNTQTPYQHDNYGIYYSTQPQPSHRGYIAPTMYQAHPEQPLKDRSAFYGRFDPNTSTSSPPWPRPHNSTPAMSYTAPHQAQMPGHGASSYHTYPPSGGFHVTNPDEFNDQFYHDLLRISIPNSGSHYTAHGGAGTSQYNQSHANSNNSSQQWRSLLATPSMRFRDFSTPTL